jgi:hypothetical protein
MSHAQLCPSTDLSQFPDNIEGEVWGWGGYFAVLT